MIRFSDEDRARIKAAINAAEKNTSGEFVAVVARFSDHYVFLPLLWAAVIALLVPGIFLMLSMPLRFSHIYEVQLSVFVLLAVLLLFIPELHLALIPKHIKHARASRLAKAQFYLQGVHLTREHVGVLFFVSLAERYVEIVADHGIHGKIGEEHWQAIVRDFVDRVRQGDVVDGFAAAIAACGDAMSTHYPSEPGSTVELSDGLIEI